MREVDGGGGFGGFGRSWGREEELRKRSTVWPKRVFTIFDLETFQIKDTCTGLSSLSFYHAVYHL